MKCHFNKCQYCLNRLEIAPFLTYIVELKNRYHQVLIKVSHIENIFISSLTAGFITSNSLFN